MKNLPAKALANRATSRKHAITNTLVISLALLWVCFLLMMQEQTQMTEPMRLIQAYIKNISILVMDKVYFFIPVNI